MNRLAETNVWPNVSGRCLTARATHAPHRANLRCLGLSVGIAIAAISLAACKTDAHDATQTLAAKQHEENAIAGYMVRLGYARWTTACGFDVAKHGGTPADAQRKCVVDFHFTGPITGEA